MNLLKNFEPEKNFKRKYLPFILVIVISVVVLEIWATNRLATYGEKITELERSRVGLEMENQLLEKEIAEKASLYENEKISKKLGFGEIKNIEYLKIHDLALNHN